MSFLWATYRRSHVLGARTTLRDSFPGFCVRRAIGRRVLPLETGSSRGERSRPRPNFVTLPWTRYELPITSSATAQKTDVLSPGSEARWNLHKQVAISGDTSSLEATNTMRRWLRICQGSHDHCNRRDQADCFPKRILKLIDKVVQLCERFESQAPYACLSHCWGPVGPMLQLKRTTIDSLKVSFLIEQLPKTFRDAALLCQSLGIHYLWIDALCELCDASE